ncbi:TPA: PIN-like domain-containing protein [Streptococcus suis]
MGKMKDLFPEFYQDSLVVSDFAENDKPNLVIFDSNFLLDILRLPTEVAKKYLEAIDKVKGHIFVPYLVGVEFNFNKKKVKIETQESIKLLKQNLHSSFEDNYQHFFEKWYNELLDSKSLSFLSNKAQRENLQESFKESATKFSQEVEKRKKQMFSELDKSIEAKYTEELDKLTSEIIELLGNSVAEKLEQEWLDKVQESGSTRYDREIPPGFNDRKNKGTKVRCYSGLSYEQQYGDYIIWEEILHKVARDGNGYGMKVIFVTSDGNSESKYDIMYKVKGKTVGPNIYMVNELYNLKYGYDILSNPTPSEQRTEKILFVIDGFRFMSLANALNKDEAKIYQPEIANVDSHQSSLLDLDRSNQVFWRTRLDDVTIDLEELDKKYNEIYRAYSESRDEEQRNYYEKQLEEIGYRIRDLLSYRNKLVHSLGNPYSDDGIENEVNKERILAERRKADRLWTQIEEIENELEMITDPEIISALTLRKKSLIEKYRMTNRKIRRLRRRLNEN